MQHAWLMVPVVVGASQPLLWEMNLRVARRLGDMEAAVALHVVGAVVGLGWLAAGLRGPGLAQAARVPWWAWLAGAVGVTGMAAMNRAMPRTGVAAALALAVAAQLGAALLAERLGWTAAAQPVAPSRWLGAALLAVGAWLVSR